MLSRLLNCAVLVCALVSSANAASNPVPFIGAPLAPASRAPGGAAFVLKVTGTGFVLGSSVQWNGSALATSYVSGQILTAKVTASLTATPGAVRISVLSPAPGDGLSNAVPFEVTPVTPSVFLFGSAPATPDLTGSLVARDFNGDGKPDIIAAVGASIAVLLGNGDGTFVVRSFPTTAQSVGTLVAGDFNGDGKLDLAFSDSAHNLLHTLLGNGDGTFTEKSTTVVGLHPAGTAVGDFNGDGNLDVAVVNQGARSVSILLGKGDGTFNRKPTVMVGRHPGNLTVADVNGDGRLDLAVVNNADNTLSILLGQGDGTFKLASSPATGTSPYGVTASDFNGDGKIDLAVTNLCGDAASCQNPGYASISILSGAGDGTFTTQSVVLTAFSHPKAIAAADFNGDGKADLVVTGLGESRGLVLIGNGRGGFAQPVTSGPGQTGEYVVLGDFNQDGRLDFALNNLAAVQGGQYVVVEEQVPVAFYPEVLTFPAQSVGTTSAPKTMRFENVGVSTIHITKTEVGSYFAGTNDCPATLAAGASCNFTITFTPGFVGLTGGGVLVDDDAAGSQQFGYLVGRGK
jgi:hypothetical protein